MRKFFLTGSFVILLAAAVFATVKLSDVDANDSSTVPVYKHYTSYEICPGDSLTSIAKEYTSGTSIPVDEYIDELVKNNQLTSDKIISGEKLIVAYYSDKKEVE